MASVHTGAGLLSAKATRRRVMQASISGALGLSASWALDTLAKAAPAILRGSSRQTIKLVNWFQSDPERSAAWATLINQFNTSQKDYKVVMGGWSAEAYANEVLLQAQEGSINADLILLLPELGPRLMRLGLLSAIDDVIAKVGVHPTKAHDFMRMNGQLYGLSMVEVPFALIYNQQVLARASISKPASTIEEWQSQLKRLTHKNHRYGIWWPNAKSEIGSWWFQLQEFCLAYDTVWAVGQTPLLNTDKIIKGLELWKTQYTHSMPAGATFEQAYKLFSHGQIAEVFDVPAAMAVYYKQTPVYQHLRSAPPPWPTKKSLSRLHPLSIVAGTSKLDGAKAFVEFMAMPSHMAQLMQRCLDVVPPYPEIWQEPSFKKYMAAQNWAAGYQEIVAVPFPNVMGDFIDYNAEFGNIVSHNLQKALFSKWSIADAMDRAQQQAIALGTRVFH